MTCNWQLYSEHLILPYEIISGNATLLYLQTPELFDFSGFFMSLSVVQYCQKLCQMLDITNYASLTIKTLVCGSLLVDAEELPFVKYLVIQKVIL